VHLILSLSISYPYLVNFHYFGDSSQEGDETANEGCTSYPYLVKFHYFGDNSQEGMNEASNEGCTSGTTGHDFTHNFIGSCLSRQGYLLCLDSL